MSDLNIYKCCYCGKGYKYPSDAHACECSHGEDFVWLRVDLDIASKTFNLSAVKSRVIMREDRWHWSDEHNRHYIRWGRTCIPERVDEVAKSLLGIVKIDIDAIAGNASKMSDWTVDVQKLKQWTREMS